MKTFEILPHTADLRIRVEASTKAGLVSAALQGVFAALEPREPDEDADEVRHAFTVRAGDFPALLVNLLNEALSIAMTETLVFEDLSLSLITDKEMHGELVGRPCRGFEEEIKAVTHHDLEVTRNEAGRWETILTCDV